MIMNVKKINKDAVIPMFAHPTDSGFDLFTCEDITVSGGKKGIAKTGLIFEIKGNNFPDEMKYIPCFYLRGAFDESKIKSRDKILMQLLKKFIGKKDDSDYEEWEKAFIESTRKSEDWTCKESLKPIIEYINLKYE